MEVELLPFAKEKNNIARKEEGRGNRDVRGRGYEWNWNVLQQALLMQKRTGGAGLGNGKSTVLVSQ